MALDRAAVVKKAEAFVREGKLDQAAAEYRALVEENPGDSGAANSLGDLYARLGDPIRAIEQYTNLGESEWLQGFSAKAAAFYKKALKVDSNCETALLRLGEIAASQSLRVDAARHWKRLLERRRLRGDAAGEAEVAGWLADLEGARATRRQATSVGMTPRVETPAIPELAAAEPAARAQPVTPEPGAVLPIEEADPSETEISSQVPWAAALLAAPSETRPSMAVALAAMPADDMPLVVEQFGQLSEVPATVSLPPDGEADVLFEPSLASPEGSEWLTVNRTPTDGEPAHLVELGEVGLVAGATMAFAGEGTPAVDSVQDDWEIVVDIGDVVDIGEGVEMPGTLDAAEVPSVPVASEASVSNIAPGEPADAGALIAELIEAAETPSLRFQAAVHLGRLFLQRGDVGRGIEWLEQACGVTAPVRDHGLLARYDLADALERAGEHTRALDVLSDLEMDAGSYRDVSVRMTRLSRATGSAP